MTDNNHIYLKTISTVHPIVPLLAQVFPPSSFVLSNEVLTLETSAFRIPVRWSINIINSVDKTNVFCSFCV